MQQATFSSPWIPVCDLSEGNSNLGNQEHWRPCRLGPERDAQMIHLCWCLCFHRSSWLEEMGQGKAGEAAQREPRSGMVQGIAAPHAAASVEGLSARGFCFHRKRRENESWDGKPAPSVFSLCVSECLSAFLSSACSTQGGSCGGFPNMSVFGLSHGSSLPYVSGVFFWEAGVVNSTSGFPGFQDGRMGWQVTGLVTVCKCQAGSREAMHQGSGPGRCTLPPAVL